MLRSAQAGPSKRQPTKAGTRNNKTKPVNGVTLATERSAEIAGTEKGEHS